MNPASSSSSRPPEPPRKPSFLDSHDEPPIAPKEPEFFDEIETKEGGKPIPPRKPDFLKTGLGSIEEHGTGDFIPDEESAPDDEMMPPLPVFRPSLEEMLYEDDNIPPPSPQSSFRGLEEKEDVVEKSKASLELEKLCSLMGWSMEHVPTLNPFFLYSLCSSGKPFVERAPAMLTAHQLTGNLESSYASAGTLRAALKFRPKPGDIIVDGALRSGQTPILHILACLRKGKIISREDLLEEAQWIEGTHQYSKWTSQKQGDRLLKTHLPLRMVFGGIIPHAPPGARPSYHCVVVLRNPEDLRLSWFRHVRRVFRKFHDNNGVFDGQFTVDDFARIPLYALAPLATSQVQKSHDYEDFIAEVIQPVFEDRNPLIHVVFYEELLEDPQQVIEKLAQFTGLEVKNKALIQEIGDMIKSDPSFPKGHCNPDAVRVGSSGFGKQYFNTPSKNYFECRWKDSITSVNKSKFTSYEHLIGTESEIIKKISQETAATQKLQGKSSLGTFRGRGESLRMRGDSFHTNSAPKLQSKGSISGMISKFSILGMSRGSMDAAEYDTSEHSSENAGTPHGSARLRGSSLGLLFFSRDSSLSKSRSPSNSILHMDEQIDRDDSAGIDSSLDMFAKSTTLSKKTSRQKSSFFYN